MSNPETTATMTRAERLRGLDDAYWAGFRAADRSKPASVCPHAEGDPLRAEWMRGYDDAEGG